ncbi:MAG: DUF5615 family PIN-like protein, partial [Verrucomicrobiota bacterium]|nr:DUF5615 family PIN-like protein [Verrucomicrobiota bacterium]
MSAWRLHFDHDAGARALVAALRRRNIDVSTSHGAGLTRADDESQLRWATQEFRVIFSHNMGDFCRLHAHLRGAAFTHTGIVLCRQTMPLGDAIRRLLT